MLNASIIDAVGLPPALERAMDNYQRFGIELEYEGVREARNLRGMPWTAVRDGSLRNNGVEYVSDPLSFRDVGPNLTRIMRYAARQGARVTPRCGLHVHINMRPYTVGQVLSLAVVYGLVEPSVFRHFADGREFSPFCVPQYANTLLLTHLQEDTQHARLRQRVPLRNVTASSKYAALNYSSLRTFGTVEARHLHGTLDPREAREWVEFWKRVVDYAIDFNDPVHVMDHFERGGIEELQVALLGEVVEVDPLDQEDAEAACMLVAGDEAEGMDNFVHAAPLVEHDEADPAWVDDEIELEEWER
jgi:hypothetical protein